MPVRVMGEKWRPGLCPPLLADEDLSLLQQRGANGGDGAVSNFFWKVFYPTFAIVFLPTLPTANVAASPS